VRLLLDTHVLIWWLGREWLSERATSAIADEANQVLVSAASVWEAELKAARGNLDLRVDLAAEAADNGFTQIAITSEHAIAAARLPLHHGDPFDRMLVAQARLERLTLVSRDAAFAAYDVDLLAA